MSLNVIFWEKNANIFDPRSILVFPHPVPHNNPSRGALHAPPSNQPVACNRAACNAAVRGCGAGKGKLLPGVTFQALSQNPQAWVPQSYAAAE